MTVPRTASPVAAADVDAAAGFMRSQGVRVSAARRLVLEALFAADVPVSAERIAAGLEGRVPSSDLASVYRNLDRLEELGLVTHFHVGHGPSLYGLIGAERREYLVCEACGAVQAVAPGVLDGVRERIRSDLAFEASFAHFPLGGTCSRCARA